MVKNESKKDPIFIDFEEALEVFHSLGVPIGRTTLYSTIKHADDLPCKYMFGRYVFDRERLVAWIKKTLEN